MSSHDNSEWEDFDALLEAALPSQSHNKKVHEQTDAEMAAELEAALSSAQEDESSNFTEEELEFAKELEDALNEDDTVNDTRAGSHKSPGHMQTPIRDTSGGRKGTSKRSAGRNDRTASTSSKTQTSSTATAELVVVESQRASPRDSPSESNLSPRPGTKAATTTTTKKKSLDTTKKSPARKAPTRKQGSSKKASSAAHEVTAPEQPTIIERTSSTGAGAVNVKPLLALPGTVPAVTVDRNDAPRAICPLPRPRIGPMAMSNDKAAASDSTPLEQSHATEPHSVPTPSRHRPAQSKNAPKSRAARKRGRAAAPPPAELPPQETTNEPPTMTPLPDWMLDPSKQWGTGLPKGPYRVHTQRTVEAPARPASAPQLEAAQGSRPVVGDRHHSAPVPSTSGKRVRRDEEEGEWEDIGDDCMMLVPKRAKLADFEPRKDAQPGSSSTVLHAPSYPSFPTASSHPSDATPAAQEALTAGGRVARTSVGNAAASSSGGMQHAPARQALPVQSDQLHWRATHTAMHPDAPPSAVPGLQFAMPRYTFGQRSSARAPGPNVIPYAQALQDTRVAQLPVNTTAPRNATPMPGPVEGLPRPILRHPAPNAQRQRLSEAIESLHNPHQQSAERSQTSILAPSADWRVTEQPVVRTSVPAIREPSGVHSAKQELQRNPWPSMQMLPGSAETWQGPGRAPQMQMDDSAARFPPPQLHGMDASYEANMQPSVMTHFHAAMPVPKETRNRDQGIAVRAQPRAYAPPAYPPPGWNPYTSQVESSIGGSVPASGFYPRYDSLTDRVTPSRFS